MTLLPLLLGVALAADAVEDADEAPLRQVRVEVPDVAATPPQATPIITSGPGLVGQRMDRRVLHSLPVGNDPERLVLLQPGVRRDAYGVLTVQGMPMTWQLDGIPLLAHEPPPFPLQRRGFPDAQPR